VSELRGGCFCNLAGEPVGQKAVYPEFLDVAICQSCKSKISVELPKESFSRWLYYAKTEILQVYRDEQCKAVGKGRSGKIKAKKVPLKSEEVRQIIYGVILKNNDEKNRKKLTS